MLRLDYIFAFEQVLLTIDFTIQIEDIKNFCDYNIMDEEGIS